MKKFLYCCAVIAIIQVHFTSPCSQPNVQSAPIIIQMLKEKDPSNALYFESEIGKALKRFYAQNGCDTMAQMTLSHGDDECLRLYQLACLDALREYGRAQAQQQAIKAAEFYNW